MKTNIRVRFLKLFSLFLMTTSSIAGSNGGGSSNTELCNAMEKLVASKKNQQVISTSTPVELLQLIKIVHENFLLMDPEFIRNNNLERIFITAKLQQKWPFGVNDKTIWKEVEFAPESPLAGTIKLSSIGSGLFGGMFYYRASPKNFSLTAELVEKELVPGVLGVDPFGTGFIPSTNETLMVAGKRPLATNIKGYYEYRQTLMTSGCRSQLMVRLNGNGNVLDIDLTQEQK